VIAPTACGSPAGRAHLVAPGSTAATTPALVVRRSTSPRRDAGDGPPHLAADVGVTPPASRRRDLATSATTPTVTSALADGRGRRPTSGSARPAPAPAGGAVVHVLGRDVRAELATLSGDAYDDKLDTWHLYQRSTIGLYAAGAIAAGVGAWLWLRARAAAGDRGAGRRRRRVMVWWIAP
jgi:hypothetical protein